MVGWCKIMTDEEKKAIKVVNKRTERLIEELKIEEDLIDEPKIAYLITQIEANKTLVNLIEKQSKEIEEINDKIKAKIEELDNQKRQWIEDRDNKHKDSEIIYAIEVLQSLLEKEKIINENTNLFR